MPFPGGVKQRFQAHTWTRPHPREGSCTVEYNWLFCQKPVFKPINLRHQPAAIYHTRPLGSGAPQPATTTPPRYLPSVTWIGGCAPYLAAAFNATRRRHRRRYPLTEPRRRQKAVKPASRPHDSRPHDSRPHDSRPHDKCQPKPVTRHLSSPHPRRTLWIHEHLRRSGR